MLNKQIREVDLKQRESNLAKLPEMAFLKNTVQCTGPYGIPPMICIKKGEDAYYPVYVASTAEELNKLRGVTAAQAAAMFNGSIFGWDTPSADPDNPCNRRVGYEAL